MPKNINRREVALDLIHRAESLHTRSWGLAEATSDHCWDGPGPALRFPKETRRSSCALATTSSRPRTGREAAPGHSLQSVSDIFHFPRLLGRPETADSFCFGVGWWVPRRHAALLTRTLSPVTAGPRRSARCRGSQLWPSTGLTPDRATPATLLPGCFQLLSKRNMPCLKQNWVPEGNLDGVRRPGVPWIFCPIRPPGPPQIAGARPAHQVARKVNPSDHFKGQMVTTEKSRQTASRSPPRTK